MAPIVTDVAGTEVAGTESVLAFLLVLIVLLWLDGLFFYLYLVQVRKGWLDIKEMAKTTIGNFFGLLGYILLYAALGGPVKTTFSFLAPLLFVLLWPDSTASPGLAVGAAVEVAGVERSLITALLVHLFIVSLGVWPLALFESWRDGFAKMTDDADRADKTDWEALWPVCVFSIVASLLAALLAKLVERYDDVFVLLGIGSLWGAIYALKRHGHHTGRLRRACVRLDGATWIFTTWSSALKIMEGLQGPEDQNQSALFCLHLGLLVVSFLLGWKPFRGIWILAKSVLAALWTVMVVTKVSWPSPSCNGAGLDR